MRFSARKHIALAAALLFVSGMVTAMESPTQMDSRDAPNVEARPLPKRYSIIDVAAIPLVVVPRLPAPSSTELSSVS
jgi:hypothetical protein